VQILVLIGLHFLKCTKFDQLIIRKIIKILATRCQILTLKCTKIDFGWGSAPDPASGTYSAPPDPLAGFKGPTSKGRGREGSGGEGEDRSEGKGGERRGGGGEEGEGGWFGGPPFVKS